MRPIDKESKEDNRKLGLGDIKIEILVNGDYVKDNQQKFWDMVKTITADAIEDEEDDPIKSYKISRIRRIVTKTEHLEIPEWEELANSDNDNNIFDEETKKLNRLISG